MDGRDVGLYVLSLRGPEPDAVPVPLLPGRLFLVLGQGRWSGFFLNSGLPETAPAAGLVIPVLIVGRLAAGRDAGLPVLSLRRVLPVETLGPSNDRFS